MIKDQNECGAAEVLLKDVIKSLSSKFEHHNVKLIYRVAEDSTDALSCLSKQCDVGSAFSFDHTLKRREREQNQRRVLHKDNVRLIECQTSLLSDPHATL